MALGKAGKAKNARAELEPELPPAKRPRPTPRKAVIPCDGNFLPLGMMARMIHNQGADGLGIASDAESSDEEEDNDTDMGE